MERVALSRALPLLLVLAFTGLLALSPTPASADPSRHSADASRASKQKRDDSTRRHRSKRARRAAERRKAKRRRHRARQRRRSKPRLALSDGVALTPAQQSVAGESPGVLFRGDFESGFGGWHLQSLASRASLFSGGAFQGNGAARFEVQHGDVEPATGSQRSEVSGPTFDEGQDLYIRDAIRIPAASSYEGPWQIVQQLHEVDWNGSPGLAVFLDADDTLELGRGDGDATYWESGRLQRDRWHDLVYRVYLSQDPNRGFVEVWLDGVQQTLENGTTRAYGETIQAPQTYIKAGVYRSRSSTGTSLVEHDAIVVGASLAAVAGS